MNVLILTPDAVGSTLLQRLITIYMQFHKYDRPVINLHELTNGLVKYYNPTFDQEILGKKEGKWGYHQSLEQIVDLLDTTDHYKTSRLAHYHIKNRQDPIEHQLSFYQYLNENFYIISCRRHNLFEHALSWCLSKVTKKLNVYSDQEKIDSFFCLYKEGIDIDPNSVLQTLEAYRQYLEWCDNYFHIASYFYYEEHLPNIENYILNLPIFSGQQRLGWKDAYNIEFNDWNRYHYLKSDIGSLALTHQDQFNQLTDPSQLTLPATQEQEQLFLKDYQNIADPAWPRVNSIDEFKNLPETIQSELTSKYQLRLPASGKQLIDILPQDHQKFLACHEQSYTHAQHELAKLQDTGVIISGPPIKKQTLAEKKHIIRNFDHCLDVYNQWILKNPQLGNPISNQTIDAFAQREQLHWQPDTQIQSTLIKSTKTS